MSPQSKLLCAISILLTFLSCQTSSKKLGNKLNFKYNGIKITNNTPTPKAIAIAIEQGGNQIVNSIKLINKRKDWKLATPALQNIIINKGNKYSLLTQLNASNIYQSSPYPLSIPMMVGLLRSQNHFKRKIAWKLATNKPSKKVAHVIDNYITWTLENNLDKDLQDPGIAYAIGANKIKTGYSILKHNLMQTGHESFVEVMIDIDPRKASIDFLNYLALAPYEEIRQIHMKTINPISANMALNHLRKFPPSIGENNFTHLFLYAVSRNTLLANSAMAALEPHYKSNRKLLAIKLARAAPWMQIAFIEANRRKTTNTAKLFLRDLRKFTPDEDVIDEIDSIR